MDKLFDNALDFLLSAVEHVEKKDARSLKYALLHLVSGIELIMKERLKREHWSLVFADMKKASKTALSSGDFQSVDFNDAIQRLKNISSIDFVRYDKDHESMLKTLRDKRNKVEHFQFTDTKEAVVVSIMEGWSFVYDFLEDHLKDRSQEQEETIQTINNKVIRLSDYVKKRWFRIKKTVEKESKGGILLICPRCHQEALIINGGQPKCPFCHYTDETAEVFDEWMSDNYGMSYIDPKERSADPIDFDCPECGAHTFAQIPDENMEPPSPAWICFSCGYTAEADDMKECPRCGRIYSDPEFENVYCNDCWREVTEKD